MPVLSRREALVIAGGLASGLIIDSRSIALAAEHAVDMLNKDPDDPKRRNIFLPTLLSTQPGDSVTFVLVDKGHNSASIEGMIPEGAEAWKGKVNTDITVTLDKPGYYGYQCTPHYGLGMVGLIVVEGEGKLANLEAAKAVRQRGRAKAVFDEIWAQAEADGLLS